MFIPTILVVTLAVVGYGGLIIAAHRSVLPTLELTENDIVPKE